MVRLANFGNKMVAVPLDEHRVSAFAHLGRSALALVSYHDQCGVRRAW